MDRIVNALAFAFFDWLFPTFAWLSIREAFFPWHVRLSSATYHLWFSRLHFKKRSPFAFSAVSSEGEMMYQGDMSRDYHSKLRVVSAPEDQFFRSEMWHCISSSRWHYHRHIFVFVSWSAFLYQGSGHSWYVDWWMCFEALEFLDSVLLVRWYRQNPWLNSLVYVMSRNSRPRWF